ncbi:hypothetical protein NDU88_004833 [Pleurodeles waltl]|uniref:Uncharacterized protein n=1 Tax=Pleurodeles waltl TaxID=8319 RepID=A0AAV7LJB1_PLEWA|nr:hypothetical protein NDU88_004833 [Pleurodeles waltl]
MHDAAHPRKASSRAGCRISYGMRGQLTAACEKGQRAGASPLRLGLTGDNEWARWHNGRGAGSAWSSPLPQPLAAKAIRPYRWALTQGPWQTAEARGPMSFVRAGGRSRRRLARMYHSYGVVRSCTPPPSTAWWRGSSEAGRPFIMATNTYGSQHFK